MLGCSFVSVQAILTYLFLLLPFVAAAAPAAAQSDPASVERTIPKLEAAPGPEQTRFAAPAAPARSGGRVAGKFVLGAVNIEGATVFSAADLAQSFEPFLASKVGQPELDRIAGDITHRYRRAGYQLSYATLPEQSVRSGIVRIRVVEAFVDKVRVEGPSRSAAAVRAIADRLLEERPLRTSTLERALGLMRALPGVVVTDVRISRSPLDASRHQLVVMLGSDRVRAVSYSDNRGTIDGARTRGYSSFSIASLAVPGDQLQLDLFAIPSDKFRFLYGQAKASVPLGSRGLRFSAAASRADQLQRLAGPDRRGKSRQLVAELAFPFAKARALSLEGQLSLSAWNSEQRLAGAVIQRDRLHVASASIELASVANPRIDGRISISRGLDIGSDTKAGDPLASRPGAGARFTKFDAELQIAAPVADRVLLRFQTSGQYSTKPLLIPEVFALGGSRIGRAFDFNELTGDHGVGAMLELGYTAGDRKKRSRQLQLFSYVDGGGVFRKRPGDLPREQWLAGAGAGARFSVLGVMWSGEVGVPVARSNAGRHVRAFFSATRIF